MNQKKVKLFSLNANKQLAEEISKTSGLPLSTIEIKRFADGEIYVNIVDSVRGQDVFVIQPTCYPVNENLMELFIFCDAIKRASAKSLTVLMPYYGYSRQDRKAKSRQPITAKLVADLLQAAGATRVICLDLHAAQIQGFYNIPIDNFSAVSSLAKHFMDKDLKNLVVVSPDHGGVTRARLFSKILDCPLAIIDKRRPEPNQAEIMHIIGDVAGMTAIMVDDIIDTAGTICLGANALIEKGFAKEVYVCATHAVFSGDAIKKINESCIKEVVVTNTIPLNSHTSDKITQISIGDLLGRAVINIMNDEPISQIFEYLMI
jgi:ribose-phosphate pyrophosphokinase